MELGGGRERGEQTLQRRLLHGQHGARCCPWRGERCGGRSWNAGEAFSSVAVPVRCVSKTETLAITSHSCPWRGGGACIQHTLGVRQAGQEQEQRGRALHARSPGLRRCRQKGLARAGGGAAAKNHMYRSVIKRLQRVRTTVQREDRQRHVGRAEGESVGLPPSAIVRLSSAALPPRDGPCRGVASKVQHRLILPYSVPHSMLAGGRCSSQACRACAFLPCAACPLLPLHSVSRLCWLHFIFTAF